MLPWSRHGGARTEKVLIEKRCIDRTAALYNNVATRWKTFYALIKCETKHLGVYREKESRLQSNLSVSRNFVRSAYLRKEMETTEPPFSCKFRSSLRYIADGFQPLTPFPLGFLLSSLKIHRHSLQTSKKSNDAFSQKRALSGLSHKRLSHQTERFLSVADKLYPAWQVGVVSPYGNAFSPRVLPPPDPKRACVLPHQTVLQGRSHSVAMIPSTSILAG